MENTQLKKINKEHKTFYMNKSVLSKLNSLSQTTTKKAVDILEELILEKYESMKEHNSVDRAKAENRRGLEDLAFFQTQILNEISEMKLEVINQFLEIKNKNISLEVKLEEEEKKKVAYAKQAKEAQDKIDNHNKGVGIIGKRID